MHPRYIALITMVAFPPTIALWHDSVEKEWKEIVIGAVYNASLIKSCICSITEQKVKDINAFRSINFKYCCLDYYHL